MSLFLIGSISSHICSVRSESSRSALNPASSDIPVLQYGLTFLSIVVSTFYLDLSLSYSSVTGGAREWWPVSLMYVSVYSIVRQELIVFGPYWCVYVCYSICTLVRYVRT